MPVQDVVTAVVDWKNRIDSISLYSDYYRGRHRIGQFATEAFKRDYLWILENARENLCKAVVRGFSSKMVIQGWEGGGQKAAGAAVKELGLTKIFNLTHRESFRTGDAYVLIWPDVNGDVRPWSKLSSQVSVKTSPADPTALEWAAMLWISETGHGRVNLYYADRLEQYRTSAELRQPSSKPTSRVTWPDKVSSYESFNPSSEPGGEVASHDFGEVPWLWFPHDSDELGCHGRSVLEDVIPLQDGLNKSVADLIVGGENFAQPLRYLMNYRAKRQIDPATGEVTTEKIQADPTVNKLLTVPGDGPLGQLDPPDATRLLAVHEAYAIKISRVVGLPAFYVSQVTGEPPTGIALRVLSTRLTNLSSETMTDFTPEWAKGMRLLGIEDVEPIWKDPAPVDESEELDNAVVRKSLGYGFRENLRELGKDDEDIDRILLDAQSASPSVLDGGNLAARAFEAGVDPAQLVG